MSEALHAVGHTPFDEDLVFVERFLAGDPGGFDALYQKHYKKVLSLATGVLLRHEEALDAAQEIWSLVHRNLHRFDRRSKFSTWLYRVAVNRSIQYARMIKHQKNELPIFEIAQTHTTVMPQQDPVVAQAMSSLSPDDRALLTLFYWEELSLPDIAQSLGCSHNAAKTRLFRARERFKTRYEELSR